MKHNELTVVTGTHISQCDLNKLPKPNYLINQKVWCLRYNQLHECEIIGIDYKLKWFDNNYTSRFSWEWTYELTTESGCGTISTIQEDIIFADYAEACVALQHLKSAIFESRTRDLQKNIKDLTAQLDRLNTALKIHLKNDI
jgi:hypothetical protein